MREQLETERKYDLRPGQEPPSLADVVTAGRLDRVQLSATYYDTPGLLLQAARITLRRRTGGHDAGWHLKLPGSQPGERVEVHEPPDTRRLPVGLRDRLAGRIGEAALLPVADLRTDRQERQLLDDAGRLVALVCADDVRAEAGGRHLAWRELEVELAGGPPGLLDAVEAVLGRAGITPAASASKIGRALAGVAPKDPIGAGSTAGEALLAYLATQVGVLQALEGGVRADAPDAVHRSRVATRRLRSVLRTYRRLLRPAPLRRLRAELRWHAGKLGAARDAEVLRERLLADAASQPDAVRALLADHLSGSHGRAQAELVASLDTDRYDQLAAALADFVADPPLRGRAARPALRVLPPLLARSAARAARLAERAAAQPTDPSRWHQLRKAAKAARYAADLAAAVQPAAADQAAAWERVTETLGAAQDAVIAQRVLGELGRSAGSDSVRDALDRLRAAEDERWRAALTEGRAALAAALAAG